MKDKLQLPNYLPTTRHFFAAVHNPKTAVSLNENLTKISQCAAYQWKRLFNSDTSKQPQETVFPRKIKRALIIMELFISTICQWSRRMFKNIWVYFLT